MVPWNQQTGNQNWHVFPSLRATITSQLKYLYWLQVFKSLKGVAHLYILIWEYFSSPKLWRKSQFGLILKNNLDNLAIIPIYKKTRTAFRYFQISVSRFIIVSWPHVKPFSYASFSLSVNKFYLGVIPWYLCWEYYF